jgi:16S rRNA (adenine1518-N6/adenine1519-N6)-dimethyltransferase
MPYPRKRFAQHWLKDAEVHQDIVAAAGLDRWAANDPKPTVLEIGPGTGQLTHYLLNTGASVFAVEIDRDLCQILRKRFADQARFQLLEADFLKIPLPTQPTLLVANIPYNITSPILEKVLGSPEVPVHHFQRIVLLVQKELADRLTAIPGNKAYGAMSVRVQYLAECHLIRIVPPQAFKPAPKVESAVICLQPRPWPKPAQDPRWFSVLVQQGFSTRRKMLVNALQSLVDKDSVTHTLQQMDLDPQIRAEQLSVEEWITLSDHLRIFQVT